MKMKVLALASLLLLLPGCFKKTERSAGDGRKVLRLALGDDVKFADPAQMNDQISAQFTELIFEGLYGFSFIGKTDEVVPLLAAEPLKFEDSGKRVIVKLRKGVEFQDDPAFPNGKGREVTVEDFIYSFKRMSDPRLNGPNFWSLDGIIEGLNEWRDAIGKAKDNATRDTLFNNPIKGFEAKDPYTLVFRLKKVYPQLPFILSMPHMSVVAKEVVTKYGPEIISHPVGTGPFMLREWVRGSKMRVVRSEKYQPRPGLDEITFDIIKEEQPRWLKFLRGELDESGIPKDNYLDAIDADGSLKKELTDKGIKLHKELSLTTWWIEFNLKDPVLGKNPKVRQALACAFDRKRALELLFNNRGILAEAPIPPVIEGARDLPKFSYEYNVDRAKTLLREAGFPEGKGLPELSFDLRGPSSTNRQLGELLRDNFSKIGVTMKILANSFPEAIEKQKTSRFQMMLGGWAADYPDAENFLQNFASQSRPPGPNSSNFSDPAYDKLYTEVRTQLPGTTRTANIRTMVEILQREVPGIFFYTSMDYRLTQKWLTTYRYHPMYNGIPRHWDVDLSFLPK